MIRALLVVAGLLMVATGQTPFDLTGLHFSDNSFHELAVCVLVLIAAVVATHD